MPEAHWPVWPLRPYRSPQPKRVAYPERLVEFAAPAASNPWRVYIVSPALEPVPAHPERRPIEDLFRALCEIRLPPRPNCQETPRSHHVPAAMTDHIAAPVDIR